MGDAATATGSERRGIDRRTLIKRAAATGAVAWTAPVIIDSLASPAAAATCGRIFRVEYRMNSNCSNVATTLVGDAGQRPTTPACTATTTPPAAYTETVTNVTQTGRTLAQGGLSVSGSCSATVTTNTTFTFSGGTPSLSPVTGCSTPLSFLAAGIYSQNMDGTGKCETRTLGAPATPNIPTLTTTSVTFVQPGSDKAAASGAWQFVIGCSCT